MSTQLSTQALHAGYDVIKSQGTQAVPIYQTTSYVFNDSDHAASLFLSLIHISEPTRPY